MSVKSNQLPTVYLPVGHEPGWENVVQEDSEYDSQSDSEALRDVAERQWRSCTVSETMGRCNVEIGPHTFLDTKFYEVTYIAHVNTEQKVQSDPPWPAVTPYGATYSSYYSPTNSGPPPSYGAISSSRQDSSHLDVMTISDELQCRLFKAMSTDPTLANLVVLASKEKATTQQLEQLAIRLRRLEESARELNLSTSSVIGPEPSPVPSREFDIVLEFREAPTELWLIPRGPALFKVNDSGDGYLKLRLPFDEERAGSDKTQPSSGLGEDEGDVEDPREYVSSKLVLKAVPETLADTFRRWLGSREKVEEYRGIFEDLRNRTKRVYLRYRLTPGDLLKQLQTLEQPHPMRLLKEDPRKCPPVKSSGKLTPNDGSTQHSPGLQETTAPPPELQEASVPPLPQEIPPLPTPLATPGENHVRRPSPQEILASPPAKKPKIWLPEVRCTICHQPDIPLYLGGKYCRPCRDSGRIPGIAPTMVTTRQNLHDDPGHSNQTVRPTLSMNTSTDGTARSASSRASSREPLVHSPHDQVDVPSAENRNMQED
ncbi:hypothetical protein CC1G_01815 [Coprinopsis cinerea okayama7|uniref:Uncharacterized protein n=1 Tax=Coprinopsis cinerea (strain Okayama-7 / 130 / ATCC MYA-4618 / FGSC 9003) TaxID=240176 RepID=A8N2G2_COPC7|nr:hypothetical protein CC1G_01815 [Coprinopsis cinerea okayama7\|eukprot:XP_001829135.2 hypothetical protein CC1G_01815 [Coprinopsis cinerea okayama7\